MKMKAIININGKDVEIELTGQKYVCFSGSTKLIEQIQQVPDNGFPFQTTIVSDNEMYLFS